MTLFVIVVVDSCSWDLAASAFDATSFRWRRAVGNQFDFHIFISSFWFFLVFLFCFDKRVINQMNSRGWNSVWFCFVFFCFVLFCFVFFLVYFGKIEGSASKRNQRGQRRETQSRNDAVTRLCCGWLFSFYFWWNTIWLQRRADAAEQVKGQLVWREIKANECGLICCPFSDFFSLSRSVGRRFLHFSPSTWPFFFFFLAFFGLFFFFISHSGTHGKQNWKTNRTNFIISTRKKKYKKMTQKTKKTKEKKRKEKKRKKKQKEKTLLSVRNNHMTISLYIYSLFCL